MSKLAIFILQNGILNDGTNERFACTFRDELSFSSRIGEPLLIANIGSTQDQGFIALGELDGFATENDGTVAMVSSIQNFPSVAAFRQEIPATPGMFEVSDATYKDVIGMVVGSDFDEAAVEFWSGTWTGPNRLT
ncbi:hypothetical protein [Devosia aurantiaca]|uniref:Uncharacterized protein n=1 Tax=Devosia aurantiaca TaxID=2714858 RepID=A0A6M1SHW1_9HYPH|nr:hypothetical protein [Devosia aurantiaca]NGP19399.1 hypothetical protein [Devosia aurantiaca]